MKIASRKNAIPSIAKGSPNTSPKRPSSPGHRTPSSNDSTVPVTAPTANSTPMTCDQRRASRSASRSLWRRPRAFAIKVNSGRQRPNGTSRMWKPSVNAIWLRAASRLLANMTLLRRPRARAGPLQPVQESPRGHSSRAGYHTTLGNFGLLYLMFIAGLELDLKLFMKRKKAAITFALLSFAIPFTLGIVSAHFLHYKWAAAVLMGSNWGSHTLVTYPLLRSMGLARNRAVATVVGATTVTDTSALLVLSIVSGTVNPTGMSMSMQLGGIGLGLAVLVIWSL